MGKGEISKFIHENSARSSYPFVEINCGAISEKLIESEFFGHEKNAFTGAGNTRKIGLFELANNGTVFLDEIGELPLEMQTRLLGVLQNRSFKRVGGTESVHLDVRIIAATNRDMSKMVAEKQFREDLFYRLSVIPLRIPTLAERADDIIPLANKFLDELNKKYGFHKTISRYAYRSLKEYSWPGNVRELKNAIEQAVIMSNSDKITVDDLPYFIPTDTSFVDSDTPVELTRRLEEVELHYLSLAYEKFGNVRDAAHSLSMAPSTYARRRKYLLEKYGSQTVAFPADRNAF